VTDSVASRLGEGRLVHVDARVFALHLLGDPSVLPLTRDLVRGIRDGGIKAQTSVLTLYQLLAEVYRRGLSSESAEIARTITIHGGLELVDVTPEISIQAAEVRAQLGGRPERALQVATALVRRADVFLTTESGLRRIAGMAVTNLVDLA
jgi:predicted nucleic acid-binding protein